MVVVSRVLDWFWQQSAERAVRGHAGAPTSRVVELSARAGLAQEAAVRTVRPAEPFAQEGNAGLACELFRQAIDWALQAHVELGARGEKPATETDAASETPSTEPAVSLTGLIERVDPKLVAAAAGGDHALAELRPELLRTHREFGALKAGEQKKLADRLEAFAQGLIEPLADVQRRLERIWVRRVLHVAGLLALFVALFLGLQRYLDWREKKNDLAPGATWKTSSVYPVGGCKSPKQHCTGGENYFFHTGEEKDPWIVFDLGKERRVSGVEIENRLDCCLSRAKPIAIDLSSDAGTWKEVARQEDEFMTLRKKWPATKARYVRIHVPSPNPAILHLSRVRIFP